MNMPKAVSLEEALKRANESFLADAEEKEQEAKKNQQALAVRLSDLRKNVDISAADFTNPDAIAAVLADKKYLEQKIFFEKAVEQQKISAVGAIELYHSSKNNSIRLAIIESLPNLNYTSLEEKEAILDLLKTTATGNLKEGKRRFLELDRTDRLYLDRYRLDWGEDHNFDIMTTAAIETLAKFGKDAEDCLVDVLRVNLGKGKPPDMREIVGRENYVLREDDGSWEELSDKRGLIVDSEAKQFFDLMQPYNALVLHKLAGMGSKKGIDFLAEAAEGNSALNLVYSEEAISMLSSMLKDARAAGEKIDCKEEKYLKLSMKPIGADLPDGEKEEILEIAKENYFEDIYKGNPEAAQRVIDEL